MAVGPVNQILLQSNYQNPGDIYLDTKTEGAFQVVVDQVNENAGIFAPGGSALIYSDTIPGLTSNNVYGQISEVEAQVQAAVGGIVPPGTITTAMLQDGAVTYAKVDDLGKIARIGGTVYAYKNIPGFL